jgi:hypothetical protein
VKGAQGWLNEFHSSGCATFPNRADHIAVRQWISPTWNAPKMRDWIDLMMLDLTARDRHATIKALALASAAMDAVPESRRPAADRAAIRHVLQQLEPSQQESALYGRAAEWILREIVTDAVAQCMAASRPQREQLA